MKANAKWVRVEDFHKICKRQMGKGRRFSQDPHLLFAFVFMDCSTVGGGTGSFCRLMEGLNIYMFDLVFNFKADERNLV